jgi:hypothetical protein
LVEILTAAVTLIIIVYHFAITRRRRHCQRSRYGGCSPKICFSPPLRSISARAFCKCAKAALLGGTEESQRQPQTSEPQQRLGLKKETKSGMI